MNRHVTETLMGAVVLVVAALFVFIAYRSGNIETKGGYTIIAKFTDIGGINTGSDVRVSGIKIGTISKLELDPESYKAVLSIAIDDDVKLPKDSSAAIIGDGLLGGKYLEITPGAEESFLSNNQEIQYTQDAVNIEELIGKFAFGGVDNKEEEKTIEKDSGSLLGL